MEKLRVLDLFSGIGGFSLGLERTGGFETTSFCEIDPYCRKVLAKHWPNVPCHDDITTREFIKGEADVICGGSPCQDISIGNAAWGERLGLDGERSGLFFEWIRAVDIVRPDYAILENVSALLGPEFSRVLGALAEIWYDAEWRSICASEIGSVQDRDRVWVIAYPHGSGGKGLVESLDFGAARQRREGSASAVFASDPFVPGHCWPQPLVRGMDGRIPSRLDRIKGCGNSVDPAIPEMIGHSILASEARTT